MSDQALKQKDNVAAYALPHCLQTIFLSSPMVFSHKIFTPVRLHAGQVPRQFGVDLTPLPRFGLGIGTLPSCKSSATF